MGKIRLLRKAATRASKTLFWTSFGALVVTHFLYYGVYHKKKYEQY